MCEIKHWPHWNKSDEYLPEMDGKYEMTNSISLGPSGIGEYDGYGFRWEGHYVEPKFWREYKTLEKRYGCVKPLDNEIDIKP